MKETYILFFSVLILSISAKPVFSQHSNPVTGQTQARITTEFIESRMYDAIKGINSDTEIEGSPYYDENWQPGYFIKTNGKRTADYPMRFSIYKNHLEFKFDENTPYIASPKPIKGFVLITENGSGELFKKGFEIPDEDIGQETFLRVLHDGKTKLLLHLSSKYQKGHSKDMFTGKYTDRYVSKSDYYLMDAKGQIERVKLKEKDILKKLEGSDNRLKSFIKKNNLNLKQQEDVVALLEEYDQMLDETMQ